MRAALSGADIERQALPRYQRAFFKANHHTKLLTTVLVVSGVLAVSLLALAWYNLPTYNVLQVWRPVLIAQVASVLVVMASLLYVRWMSRWRAQALIQAEQLDPPGVETLSASVELPESAARWARLRTALTTCGAAVRRFIHRHGDGLVTLGVGLLAGGALWLIIGNWAWQPLTAESLPSGSLPIQSTQPNQSIQPLQASQWIVAAGLVLLAFATLVLERYYAALHPNELPEAPAIASVLRVGITVSLLLAGAVLLASESRQWPHRMLIWIGLLPAAIAGELLLRVVLSPFAPPRQQEPELLTESFLAGLWRWPLRPLTHLQDELKQRFGVDLRQSWAFAYIRRALLPVLAVLLGMAWLISGLVEIPIAARGIYERCGTPVAVWQPGLHWGLPWPLGQVQRIENGVVHELSAAASDRSSNDKAANDKAASDKNANAAAAVVPDGTAEGPPPASADRLWDASHVAEKSQLIASEVTTADGSRQSFHIVNMDVRFMYRIGLDDDAALKARYRSADAPTLIRSTANRILVQYFASRTLEGVLGETRTQMATDIGTRLQADLDALNSGVEIMATVLEAIHPPAAAANAYHAVQAAQINAQAIISRERGNSTQQVNLAQLRAGLARNQATAAAHETLVTADVAKRRFIAEREAYQQGGRALLLEQYFAQLTVGLAKAQVVLVDHRLPATSTTIDLRNLTAAVERVRPAAPAVPAALRNVDSEGAP